MFEVFKKNWKWFLFPIAIILVYGLFLIFITSPISEYSIEKAGQLGDSFGLINTLFSGSAFISLVITIYLQQQDMRETKEEKKKLKTKKEIEFIIYLLEEIKYIYQNFNSIKSVANMKYGTKETTYYYRLNKFIPKIKEFWNKIIDEKYLHYLLVDGKKEFRIINDEINFLLKELENTSVQDTRTYQKSQEDKIFIKSIEDLINLLNNKKTLL